MRRYSPRIKEFCDAFADRVLDRFCHDGRVDKVQVSAMLAEAFRSDGAVFICDCELGEAEKRVCERLDDVECALKLARQQTRHFIRKLDAIIEDHTDEGERDEK